MPPADGRHSTIPETTGDRWRRRLYHYGSHPIRWTRYLIRHELRHQDVRFSEHPRFVDWKPMYRVSRADLGRLTGQPRRPLDGYFAELGPIQSDLAQNVADLPAAGALWQAPLLYVIVRAARPQRVVETGISSGYSSRFLLEALERNGSGHLDSIGLDSFALEKTPASDARELAGRHAGWLVPERLQGRWTKHIGRSEDVLPGLLGPGSPSLDVFLHDSAHVYPTMTAEYSMAWPRLSPGGWLLSHDIHTNRAWNDFLAHHSFSVEAELDHDLGAARVKGPT